MYANLYTSSEHHFIDHSLLSVRIQAGGSLCSGLAHHVLSNHRYTIYGQTTAARASVYPYALNICHGRPYVCAQRIRSMELRSCARPGAGAGAGAGAPEAYDRGVACACGREGVGLDAVAQSSCNFSSPLPVYVHVWGVQH